MSDRIKKASIFGVGLAAGLAASVMYSVYAQRETSTPLPVAELQALAEVFGRIKADYVEPVEDKKLLREAINGMVSGLDPHSAYLDEAAFKDLQTITQGKFGGLGIEVNQEDGFVKVISPIEDTPAYRAGILAGDLIFKIDDTFTKGLSLSKAVEKMRGDPGTSVVLSVSRKGSSKPLTFNLKREEIHVKSVKFSMLEPGYGYVRVRQFQEQTTEDVAHALKELIKQDAKLKGLVLDLRGDPGGLLNSAVGVSAAFLPKDALVVYTDGRIADSKMRLKATPNDYRRSREDPLEGLPALAKTVPMIVLVDAGSASASEIVAGALQDHKRAEVLGTRSFGKGSVQSVLPLTNGTGLKLTTARYYTPNGRSIQAKGIEPDVKVDDGRESPNMFKEADYENHLDDGKEVDRAKAAAEAQKRDAENKPVTPEPEEDYKPPRFEFGSKEDFTLMQALNHFKGLPVVASARKSASADKVASPDTSKDKAGVKKP